MKPDHNVQQCRWAEATLFLSAPAWLQAWDYPWSCRESGTFYPVSDTRACGTCERWQPRTQLRDCRCGGDER